MLTFVDDEAIALTIKNNLQSLGNKANSFVESVEEALEKIEIDKPDIVLMDLDLNVKLNGVETAEIIKKQFGVPVIFIAKDSNTEKNRDSNNTQPYVFVLKPVIDKELRVVINKALYFTNAEKEYEKKSGAFIVKERRYRSIYGSKDDGYYETDSDGNLTNFNESLCKILALDRDAVMGTNFREYMDEKYTRRVVSVSKRLFSNKKPIRKFVIEVFNQKGTKCFINISISAAKRAGDGNPGFFGVIEDITEKKAAERRLKSGLNHYRTLFERSSDAIFIVDTFTGKYVDANHSAELLTGLSLAEIRKKHTLDITPKRTYQRLKMMPTLKTSQEFGEIQYTRADGTTRDATFTAVPIKGNQIMGIVHDITEYKNAEKALRKIHDELELKVEARTAELANTNSALTVLLKRSDQDKTELEEKILSNVKESIIPILKKLENSRLDDEQYCLVNTIEESLNKIISPFLRILSSKYTGLTPKEVQIANLIREGLSSKEIADAIASNPNTVEFHRRNIRKKLGLSNSKRNLKVHLMSLLKT